MIVKKGTVIWSLACALLGAGCLWAFVLYQHEKDKTLTLEQQLTELSRKEKQSVIVQHISTQMEQIARDQQSISDERRREAEQQTIVANQMRQQAEQEKRKAQEAEQTARLSESKAVEASNTAEQQRQIAVVRQQEAEYARSVADTLSYLAMARSLGSLAVNQENAGNAELANLLAYAAYTYTNRFQGDVYQPAIYEALALTSDNSRKWAVARGFITMCPSIPGTDNVLTVSTYGEIALHNTSDNQLKSETILADGRYDFRDVAISNDNTFYAISYSGELVKGNLFKGQESKVKGLEIIEMPGVVHPYRIFNRPGNLLLITAEQSVVLFDPATQKIVKSLDLDFKANVSGKKKDNIILFDGQGQMYSIDKDLSHITQQPLPFRQPIMSYTYQPESGRSAYGTIDGTIYYIDAQGNMQRLIGHRSRVSRVKFYGDKLYSTSYDGTVRFWNVDNNKIEPITVLNSGQWIISSNFDEEKQQLWTGDKEGNLTLTFIMPQIMADEVHKKLTRNFTHEEWAYYIGNKIPYETFISKAK